MPYTALDGVRFHFDTYGEGDPVLLISGLSAPSVNCPVLGFLKSVTR